MLSRTRSVMAAVTAAATLMAAAGASFGQQCAMPKLTASDRAANDFFGSSLSMSSVLGSPRLMVGSPADDTAAGVNAGSVYTFARLDNEPWGQMAQIFASDGQASDFFGVSVSYSDPYAVVGATGVGSWGAAYFFERQGPTWVQVGKVTPAGTEVGADVGRSVAISGTRAIVGAPLKDVSGQVNAGAAYFYQRQANGTWTLQQTVSSSTSLSIAGEQFGSAVAMSGNLAVIGVPRGENINWPADHGYIRVYRHNGSQWNVEASLFSNNPGQADYYGSAVSTDGTFIAIGAPNDDRSESQGGVLVDSGCVYIQRYVDGAWHIDGQLFASDAAAGARFGSSVSIKDGRVVIGASGAKKAYIFRRVGLGNWVQDAVISDPDGDHGFGGDVAWDGETAMVGDPNDNPSGLANAGSVYVHRPSSFVSDSCAGAREIFPAMWMGCTRFASRDGTTTCGQPATQGADVWYRWSPACSGTATVNTFGAMFDTVVSVHTGCPDAGGSYTVACNDDAPGYPSGPSSLTFSYTAGTSYLIRVSGYGGAAGDYMLSLIDHNAPSNDTCGTAITVTNDQYTFQTCSARTETQDPIPCPSINRVIQKDVWFRYTATCTGQATVDMCGSTDDTIVAVYAGGVCQLQGPGPMVCVDDTPGGSCPSSLQAKVTFPVTAGETFLLRVGTYTANGSHAVMTISCTPPCRADWNQDGLVNSGDITAFLTDWLASVQNGTQQGDYNGDGQVNSGDITAFLTAWLGAVGGSC